MLAHLKKASEKSKMHLTEDYVVILQKITARDPGSVSGQIDTHLIENLHTQLVNLQKSKQVD
jgi:hypothetical protein